MVTRQKGYLIHCVKMKFEVEHKKYNFQKRTRLTAILTRIPLGIPIRPNGRRQTPNLVVSHQVSQKSKVTNHDNVMCASLGKGQLRIM